MTRYFVELATRDGRTITKSFDAMVLRAIFVIECADLGVTVVREWIGR